MVKANHALSNSALKCKALPSRLKKLFLGTILFGNNQQSFFLSIWHVRTVMCKLVFTLIDNIIKIANKSRQNVRLVLMVLSCCNIRDGPLEKLWGGGGIFEPEEFLFRHQIPCMNFF